MRQIFSITQKTIELVFSLFPKKRFKTFLFHEIAPENRWKEPGLAITPESFRLFLEKCQSRGLKFCDVRNYTAIINSNRRGETNFCLITFDDAYDDVYEYALPILRENNIPFIVFVCTGLIDKEGFLSQKMLVKLSMDPLCTIGAHSLSHSFFRKMNNEQSKYELKHSKEILEQVIKKKVDYFAYPYGSVYACKIFRESRNAKYSGYDAAFSTICLPGDIFHPLFFLPRICVNEKNVIRVI